MGCGSSKEEKEHALRQKIVNREYATYLENKYDVHQQITKIAMTYGRVIFLDEVEDQLRQYGNGVPRRKDLIPLIKAGFSGWWTDARIFDTKPLPGIIPKDYTGFGNERYECEKRWAQYNARY